MHCKVGTNEETEFRYLGHSDNGGLNAHGKCFRFLMPIYNHVWAVRFGNRPYPSCFEPYYESEAKCKAFHVKISFVSM